MAHGSVFDEPTRDDDISQGGVGVSGRLQDEKMVLRHYPAERSLSSQKPFELVEVSLRVGGGFEPKPVGVLIAAFDELDARSFRFRRVVAHEP